MAMTSLPIDVEFRLRAAARVLERAAAKTTDQELKQQLEKLAASLRRAAEGDTSSLRELEATSARAQTIDELVKEVREWIWRGPSTRDYVPANPREPLRPLEIDIAKRIFKPLEEFEKFLDELDRILEGILP